MEMRQLRGFLAVAETLSFSRAAERLYVSQSTLSEQIRQLEDEIGCPLFRRTSHSVSLTEVGERLRPAAAQACRDMEACREVVREMREKISGTLRVGVTSTCKSLLKRPLREMMREYPRLQLQVTYTNGLTLSEMLINKQVDIAMSMRPHRLPPEVEQEAIFNDRLCAICSCIYRLRDAQPKRSAEELARRIREAAKLHYDHELTLVQ